MKRMNKFDEMKMLQSLKGDTYFNQYFSSEDIDQMCQNIENDFAIESGCAFHEKTAALEKKVKSLGEAQDIALRSLAAEIIINNANERTLEILRQEFGKDFVIKAKYSNGIELDHDEIKYLVSKL